MKKTADEELQPRTLNLINRCPKCSGALKATVLVGFGIVRAQRQYCIDRCGFDKDIRKMQHA
jgi:hypothetical protein